MAQALEKTDKIVSADKISQEITRYFEDIRKGFDASQVCVTSHMSLIEVFRLGILKRKILFRIDRNTSDISEVHTGTD